MHGKGSALLLPAAVLLAFVGFVAAYLERQNTVALQAELGAMRERVDRLSAAADASRDRPIERLSLRSRHASALPPATQCDCPDVTVCEPQPDSGGTGFVGERPMTASERDEAVRRHLEERFERVFAEDMDEPTRAATLELLTQVRELRRLQNGHGAGVGTPPDLRDELQRVQQDLIDLTGMGVGEILAELRAGEPGVAVGPEDAPGVEPGEIRKRFADEVALGLGIVEPGSVEVFDDGEWLPQ